jgi:hypothetical protein
MLFRSPSVLSWIIDGYIVNTARTTTRFEMKSLLAATVLLK